MYIILTAAMAIGGYIPVLLGADALGGWSILGGLIGGLIGVWVYLKIRNEGYLD
jgi:prolipoprotein diacylglyceryltransferase